MKCNQCGSEWLVPKNIPKRIEKCPFCGADLHKESETIVEVLIEYGKKDGVDFFKNSMKINGLLADLFPEKNRERNALKVAFEKGIGLKVVQLHYEEDESLRDIQIKQMRQILLEDAWLSESASDFVLTTLITAIDTIDTQNPAPTHASVVEAALQQTAVSKELSDDSELAAAIMAAILASEEEVSSDEISKQHGDIAIRMGEKGKNNVVNAENKKTVCQSENLVKQISELIEAGIRYEKEGYSERAVSEYKNASRLGSSEAAYRIAEIFAQDENKIKDSIKWYVLAAEHGHSKAQNNLGYMYEHGQGVGIDFQKAIYWYSRAAFNGNMNAQHNLAFFYYSGLGTAVDYGKAFEWYTKSAKQGHPGAQNNLGIMYEYGYGTDISTKDAIRWYKTASENGNKDGDFNYKRLMKIAKVKD